MDLLKWKEDKGKGKSGELLVLTAGLGSLTSPPSVPLLWTGLMPSSPTSPLQQELHGWVPGDWQTQT